MTASTALLTALLTSLVILAGLAVVRQVRIYLFRKELFWELDPIIEADKWEGYKRDRKRSWAARRRRGADAAFAPTRAAAAVVMKYLDLEAGLATPPCHPKGKVDWLRQAALQAGLVTAPAGS